MSILRPKRTAVSGSFREVLAVAFPLILASSCHAVNMFVDRLMLTRYSPAAGAASFTGGITGFTVACLFVGTISYTGTFVAQYFGAGQHRRIGLVVWQGVFLALIGAVVLAGIIPFADKLFGVFGHDPQVTGLEITYFRIITGGVFLVLSGVALSCFWAGRGRTEVVLAISVAAMLCNLPFNYLLIYGVGKIPPLGVTGAAMGTLAAELVADGLYLALFLHRGNRTRFGTTNWRWKGTLVRRMLKFGIPNGVQLGLDLLAFNMFSLLLGSYGVAVHEAAGITFGINNIAFCPVMGVGQTVAILTGQAIGARDIPRARKSIGSAFILVTAYSLLMIVLFVFGYDLVLAPFVRPGDQSQLEALRCAKYMLQFISAYLLFDGVNITLSNALRGAGDTRFTMYVFATVGIGAFAGSCLLLSSLAAPWWSLWIAFDGEILLLSGVFFWRYRQGKWTRMRVIAPK